MDAGLKRALEAKVYAGQRLTREDGIALLESDDLAWLGRLAHHKRTEMNGDRALFSVNRRLDLAEADGRAEQPAAEELTELHIVNAVPSSRPWHSDLEVLGRLKTAFPGAGLQGFSAADIQSLEQSTGRAAGEIIEQLRGAGLDTLSGDGAGDEGWLRIHRLAHDRGMKTPASMVYGPAEEPAHLVDHLLRLRELQDETGGFAAFIPARSDDGEGAAPAVSLKIFAVSRLLFDNVPHIQASAATHQRSVAQLALTFGADELDVPATEDQTTDDDELLTLIWDAGFRPIKRDSQYAVVRTYDAAPSFVERRSEPQQVWA